VAATGTPLEQRLAAMRAAASVRAAQPPPPVDPTQVQTDDDEALRLLVHHLGAEVTEDWRRTADGWVDRVSGAKRPH
jgi:hypothetical protein